MTYSQALKLSHNDRVRIRERGILVVAIVTNLLHDVTCKVVYVSVITEDGFSYYSVPHSRIEVNNG